MSGKEEEKAFLVRMLLHVGYACVFVVFVWGVRCAVFCTIPRCVGLLLRFSQGIVVVSETPGTTFPSGLVLWRGAHTNS